MALSKIFVAPKNGQGGVKKSKKIFFSEKIFERWEKNLGTSGTIFAQNRFWGSGWGVRPTVTSLKCSKTKGGVLKPDRIRVAVRIEIFQSDPIRNPIRIRSEKCDPNPKSENLSGTIQNSI